MKMSTAGLSDLVADGEDLALRLPVLELLFDEASDVAFFVKDRDGRYLSVNQSLERVLLMVRKKINSSEPVKILVIRFSSIGDIRPGRCCRFETDLSGPGSR